MRHTARLEAAIAIDAAEAAATAPRPPPPLAAKPAPPAPDVPPRAEPEREWSPAASWAVSPVSLPPSDNASGGRQRAGAKPKTLRPARAARRKSGAQKKATTLLGRRAVASLAIASLVAGGGSYFVAENAAVRQPAQSLPPVPQAAMDADQWTTRAEVVLSSINQQLDDVAKTEATWLALPEPSRVQEPAEVRALHDHKALLEQQRATLMSQLGAVKSLPELATDLSAAQAELDAVERALTSTQPTTTTSSHDQDRDQARRLLTEQHALRLQQRDHNAEELSTARSGVEQALTSPLPDDSDDTSPIVDRVMALVQHNRDGGDGNGDSGNSSDDSSDDSDSGGRDPQPLADGGRDLLLAPSQRRESSSQERDDVGVTAPPDPDRSSLAAVLRHDGDSDRGDDSDGDSSGGIQPVQYLATSVGDTVDGLLPGSSDRSDSEDRDQDRSSDRPDEQSNDRSNDGSDGRSSDRASDRSDDRSGDKDSDDEDSDDRSDRGDGPVANTVDRVGDALGRVTDPVLGGGDSDRRTPVGKAGRDRNSSDRSSGAEQTSRQPSRTQDEAGSRGEQAEHQSGEKGSEKKTGKPSGKAERKRARSGIEEGARHVASRVEEAVREHASRDSESDEDGRSGKKTDTRKKDTRKKSDEKKDAKKKDDESSASDASRVSHGSEDSEESEGDSDGRSDEKSEKKSGEKDSDEKSAKKSAKDSGDSEKKSKKKSNDSDDSDSGDSDSGDSDDSGSHGGSSDDD